MKKILFTFTFLGVFFQLNAALVTWDAGGAAGDWSDPLNWDTDALPTSADEVDLDGTTVFLNFSTQVQRILVDGSATFTVDAGVILTIDGFAGNDQGLEIQGSATLINNGTINISSITGGSSAQGFYNKGTSTNNGTIAIQDIGSHGLYVVAGVFTNASTGIVTVTSVGSDASDADNIYVDDANSGTLQGTLTNEGNITVTSTTGDEGILVNDNSIFNNTGTITISKVGPNGDEALQTEDGGTFNNNFGGVIIINSAQDNGIVVKALGVFNNNAGSEINIDAVDNDQILVDDDGSSFTNSGIINLDNSADVGLYAKGGIFTNMSTGSVNITDATDHSIYVQEATAFVENSGTITTNGGGADSDGLRINTGGTVTNNAGASLLFNNTGADAIQIDGNSTLNNSGTISIDGTGAGQEALELVGTGSTFNNLVGGMYMVVNCADDGIEINNGAILNNDGAIRIDGSLGDDIETFGGFTFTNSATATFAPGSSPGDLLTKGDWDLGASTTTFEIDGLAAFDQIVNGDNAHTLTISSATAHLEWGYAPADGDCFKIIDGSGTVGGEFATITSSDPSITYEVDYATNTDEVIICVVVLLPVDLVHFGGEKTVHGTKLSWETASEINNNGFEIERSNDNREWTAIGNVRGNGNSYELNEYSYLDAFPSDGVNYYRLKQNDLDGHFEYSNIVAVDFESKRSEIAIYPNPVSDILYMDLDHDIKSVDLQLYNASGKLLWTRKGWTDQISFEEYSLGVYFLNIVTPENTVMRKIIKD